MYRNYAQLWYNVTFKSLDENMKKKLENDSLEMYAVKGTVYKDADCFCDAKRLIKFARYG